VTTLARLLAQKQNLLERLLQDPGPHERDEIERLLAEIDDTLNRLDETGPGSRDAWGPGDPRCRKPAITRPPRNC